MARLQICRKFPNGSIKSTEETIKQMKNKDRINCLINNCKLLSQKTTVKPERKSQNLI